MKLLVVTTCTKEKRDHPENHLVQEDFSDKENFIHREQELSDFAYPAGEMYTGKQHLLVMEGIHSLRKQFGEEYVDLYVVSAGYGLISEKQIIVPYDVTFNTMNSSEMTEWSRQLGIHENLETLLKQKQYDLVLFLLGDKYLRAINPPFQGVNPAQKFVFFANRTSRKIIPGQAPYYFVEVGRQDVKSFGCGLAGLKGYLFKLLAQGAVSDDAFLFERIYRDPNCIMAFLEKHRRNHSSCVPPHVLNEHGLRS